MRFSSILEALRENDLAIARRAGWNGKGMFIALMPEKTVPAESVSPRTRALLALHDPGAAPAPLHLTGYLAMWTAQRTWLCGWLASQSDLLADDWEVVVEAR